MAEETYKEAQGVGLVAGVLLVVAVIVALTFIWVGLTPHPTAAPAPAAPAAGDTATPAPAEAPAAETPAAPAAN